MHVSPPTHLSIARARRFRSVPSSTWWYDGDLDFAVRYGIVLCAIARRRTIPNSLHHNGARNVHWRGAMEGCQHGGGAVLFRSFWWIESRKPEGSALALAFGRLEEAALAIETPRSARFGAAACAVKRPARERSAECELARARSPASARKPRRHRWLAPLLSALHRFWRRGAAAPKPFRRLAQWKSARVRQGGAQGGKGSTEALDLACRRKREHDA